MSSQTLSTRSTQRSFSLSKKLGTNEMLRKTTVVPITTPARIICDLLKWVTPLDFLPRRLGLFLWALLSVANFHFRHPIFGF